MPKRDKCGAIVIGSDFRALGVVRSLGRRNIPCILIDNRYRAAWFSHYVIKRFKWQGPMNDEHFLSFLLTLGKECHLERWQLFPSSDDVVELIARHTQQLSNIYQLVTPQWEIVRWANDKRMTYGMARELGVPFPRTWYPSSEDDLRSLGVTFPVIIKPAISIHFHHATGLKALSANSDEELQAQYRLACRFISAEEVMIQELIPGNGYTQYSVGAFCRDGEMLYGMTARRSRQYPLDYGMNSSFVEAIEVPALFGLAEQLLRYMRVSGMVEVEFKYDQRDEQYKLLDINVRPWGWHTLCMACGLDFPYIQYCCLAGQVPASSTPHYDYRWVRLITDLPAAWQEMRAGMTRPMVYLRSLQGKVVFAVFDWHDPLPAIAESAILGFEWLKKQGREQNRTFLLL